MQPVLFTILPALGAAPVHAAPPTIVSLTFDDGLDSACTARSVLAAHGRHSGAYARR